jgi:hypothetical protein
MNDLDQLPDMSPSDVPGVPSMPDRVRVSPRRTLPMVMILAGIGLALVCGFFLLVAYGLASRVPITRDDPGYWSLVLSRMFGVKDGGSVAIPASFGMLVGVALLGLGMVKAGKRRRVPGNGSMPSQGLDEPAA